METIENLAPALVSEVGNEESANRVIERDFQEWIALKVKEFVSRRVLASVDSAPTKAEMEIYRQFEEAKMDVLTERIYDILCEVALPAAVAYVKKRFPQEAGNDFPRFDNVMFRPEYTLSSDENIESGTLPPSAGYLWGCRVIREDGEQKIGIEVMLDSVFLAFEEKEIDDEAFDDFILQILLHEVMHALSVSFYMTEESKMDAYAKWLAFLEAIGCLDPYPSWDELVTRFGYSCNFVAPENQAKDTPFRTLGDINSINEGLTDVYAARAYAQYRKNNGLPPTQYKFWYPKEAKAFHAALKEFCAKHGFDFNETFRMVELGYFFGNEEYLDAFENVIWETIPKFQEELARLRAKPVENVS